MFDTLFLEVKNDELIVRWIADLLDLLEKPLLGEPETPEQIEQDLENYSCVRG
ncbi:MAG: hypothetical protein ACTSQI_04410 [Candidatus Helarchaeota archaeon]